MTSVPGQSSTGSAEGLYEVQKPASRNWSWVEAWVWTERMVSALGNGVKGGKWYSVDGQGVCARNAEAGLDESRANEGAAGVDGQSVERFAAKAEVYLAELATAVREGRLPCARCQTGRDPKRRWQDAAAGHPDGQRSHRPDGGPSRLEPIFESGFCDGSYGFRPERGCKDALREVDRLLKAGYAHVVDADLQSLLRYDPARAADGAGRGTGQRWPRARL